MTRKFLTYKQQIERLTVNRGLVIEDVDYAESILKQIGYFSLVSTYKDLFSVPGSNKYRKGTKLEDIVALYKFDENLRELFLKYILKVERNVKSLISYYFCEEFGASQRAYLDISNYTDKGFHRGDVEYLVHSLEKLVSERGDYPEIDAYREKHNDVPLWVLVNAMTFGMLSKFYRLMPADLQEKVSREFPEIDGEELEVIMKSLNKFRNVCAHNEKLYSYKCKYNMPDFPLHAKLNIARQDGEYMCGKKDLFSLAIAFKYLLSNEDFKKFKNRFRDTLAHYMNNTVVIEQDEILKEMGFPINWEEV